MRYSENELIEKYKLSKNKHNEIYKVIETITFSYVKPVEKPIAIIVGAQPGSGKGSLIGYSTKMFKDNNFVIITTDDYKPFHPKAAELANKYPTYYSKVIEADSGEWTNKILHKAIDKKYNFIFEVTLKNDRILRRMKELKEAGFEVIVRGLAVSYIESLLSAYERYEKQVEARGWGRFFEPTNYNNIYANIPDTIEIIENSQYCDALEIYKRGEDIKTPQLVYGKYNKEFEKNYPDIELQEEFEYQTGKETIMKCRNEDIKNINEIKERFETIEILFDNRKTKQEERQSLEKLKEIIENY